MNFSNSAQNETIFLEILPELARKYEKSNFSNSLNIFIRNLNFEARKTRKKGKDDSEAVSIDCSGIQCTAKFENCVAVKHLRIDAEEEMMFGVFGGQDQTSSPRSATVPSEISDLNARLILPKPSDQYISQFEIRDFDISKTNNPDIFAAFQWIFSCSSDVLKICQRHKNEIFLHVGLEKERKTARSCIFEAVFELVNFLSKIDKINGIRLVCIPFVHFGKVRISAKIDIETGEINVKMFNLFGSLFGVIEGISSGEMKMTNDNFTKKSIANQVFLSEFSMKNKFNEAEEISEKLKNSEANFSQKSKIIDYLMEIIRFKMKIDIEDIATIIDFPLPYLGIDSLRIVEFEFHVAKKWAELELKSPFLMAHRTLRQVEEFLRKSIIDGELADGEKSIIEEKSINGEKSKIEEISGICKKSKIHEKSIIEEKSISDKNSIIARKSISDKKSPPRFEIPLSSQQKRIRFVQEFSENPKNSQNLISQFSEPILLEFSENLDVQRLQQILIFLTMRHSILRTIYHLDHQFLVSATENFISIREAEVTESSERLQCILKAPGILKLIFHHISIDGQSLSIFYKEFCEILEKSLMIIDFPREPRVQYHDYCRRKDKNFDAEHQNREFWENYLQNIDFSSLPIEAIDNFQNQDTLTASTIMKPFSGRIQKTFDVICLQNHLSRFELFIGLMELSIFRFFGNFGNFAIGFAVDEREFEYFETMGCFTNVLPYISKFSETENNFDFSKKSIIQNLKNSAETLRILRQKSIPYEQIARIFSAEKEIFNFQIFAVSDVVEVCGDKSDKKKSVRFEDDRPEIRISENRKEENEGRRIAKYEMTWYLRQSLNDDKLQFEVEYASNMLKKSTIDMTVNEIFRLINTLGNPKKSIINKNRSVIQKCDFPHSPVSQIIPQSAKTSKLHFFENFEKIDKNIYRYIDFPRKIAKITKFLRKIHVKLHGNLTPEHPILVKMARTTELVEVLIATWQAGFYPVPMHLGSTEKVLEGVKEQLGGEKVIVVEGIDNGKYNNSKISSQEVVTGKIDNLQVHCHEIYSQKRCIGKIDNPKVNIQDINIENIDNPQYSPFTPKIDNLRTFNHCTMFSMAYATCTSGSTGRPKLVGTAFIGHSNLMVQYSKSFQISETDTILQSVDPSFDIFFADVFKCLLNSSDLILARDSIPTSSELQKATVAYLMPAFLARIPDFRDLKNLKVLQFGGESLAPTVIPKLLEIEKNLRIYQEFGLTEQTVYSARRRIRSGRGQKIDKIDIRKIGKPYDNIGLEIDNDQARRGQLCLTGTGIMRGYYHRISIDIDRFPTGDEVYLDEKDEMVFVGRKDSQVKVRGFRIDLFEIECVALSSNLLHSCVCIAAENRLILFYKPIIDFSTTKIDNQLKIHLEEGLVPYKVPQRLVEVESFPLTRTGKIDRKHLRNQSISEKSIIHQLKPSPNLKAGILLLKKWLEHYSESRIPSEDVNVFSCGIDSISVMLTSQKLREIGWDIPVKTFFEKKTLRGILEASSENSEAPEAPEDQNSPPKPPNPAHFIPLNHIQERILFLSRTMSSNTFRLNFSIPIDNLKRLGLTTNTITMGNPLIRSIISRKSGDYRFLVLSATEAFFNVNGVEKTVFDNQNVDGNSNSKFETEIRVGESKNEKNGKNQYRLILSIHHLICDGRSLQILKNQFYQFFDNPKLIKFERNFEIQGENEKIENQVAIRKIDNFKTIFPNFDGDSNSKKIRFNCKFPHQNLATHRVFHAFCQSISAQFDIIDCHVACTFANRSAHNWWTVSMFANTLPVPFNRKIDFPFEEFSNRLSAINNRSNARLIDIVPPGIGRFADFAINFHKELDEMDPEVTNNSEFQFQFPILLTYSERENQSILEYDEKSISDEEAEQLKRRILKILGAQDEDEDADYIEQKVVSIFRKILKIDIDITSDIDFFASGGHSLSAMKLIDILSDELEIERDIPIKLIFDNPTPKMLAKGIRELMMGNEKEKSIVDDGQEKSIILKNQEKSIIADDPGKSIINENQEKSIIDSNQEKSIIGKLKEKSIINNLQDKLKIDKNQEKSKIDDDQEKSIVDNPLEKSIIRNFHEKSIIADNPRKSIIQENQEKSITTNSKSFPLSPQQLQMFYLSELTLSSLEYQLPFIQPFQKSINPLSIHSALLCTMQEQSIFRTIFRLDPDTSQPYQQVLSITECFVRCHVEFVSSEGELHGKIRELCGESINVQGGPLIRAAFIIFQEIDKSIDKPIDNQPKINNVAFLHLHHLISDARSTQLMNSTMKEFLEGRKARRLGYQYVDYCRDCQGRGEIDKIDKINNDQYFDKLVGGAYHLSGSENPSTLGKLKLKAEKVSILVPEYHISSFSSPLRTPFSSFLHLISPILLRHFHVPNLNITFPIINRTDPKTSRICGYFLNNLIINTAHLHDLPTVIQANLPYSEVVRELRKRIDKGMVASEVYINCRYDLEFDETDDEVLLDLVPIKLHFPLEIDIDKVGGAYRVTMRSERFGRDQMNGILGEIGAKPKAPKNQYLYGTKKDFPSRLSLPNLYREFMKSHNHLCPQLPYHNAHSRIISQSSQLSKQFLFHHASLIRSDDVIAVIGRKSIDTTCRCLAVQYSGAAYLPIDESYPEERKQQILGDAKMVFHSSKEPRTLRTIKTRHFPSSTPESLAYVITTSGTTGAPKSVAISASSVANLCLSSTCTMSVSSGSRIFQFTNFVFDNSVLEVTMALGNQAMLIYPESSVFDAGELQKSIDNPGISHCLLFPSLVQSISIDKIRLLAYWIVGGERLPQDLLYEVLGTGCHVIQNYGPTETTAFAVARRMKFGDIGTQIGRPAVNTQLLLIFGKEGGEEGEGEGELLIRGAGQMRGYLNRTSFRRIQRKDWYCSGDVCRGMENGDVQFVKRNDSQIKIRGFRVELGEIERVIEQHCDVTTCLTVFQPETQQIHAFCKMTSSNQDLRSHCQKYLEGHKVPSTFTGISEFPLTENSKIDKKKLMGMIEVLGDRSASSHSLKLEDQSIKSMKTHQELSEIWSEILNCRPSPSDDFFLSGGHSLLLIRLRHQILSRIGVSLTVPEILENLKFGDLINLIDTKKREKSRTMVFFPALYGGCTAYLRLCEGIRGRKTKKAIIGDMILLEEQFGNTVEDVARKYREQILEKIHNPTVPLTFIGASAAGTFAFATCQLFRKINNLQLRLVLLDSGTFWSNISDLKYEKHVEEITENLKNYGIDQKSGEEIAEKSWKTLQILKIFESEKIDNQIETLVLSVDGTDLGWNRFCENLKIRKIDGDHYSMLQNPIHVAKIVEVLMEEDY